MSTSPRLAPEKELLISHNTHSDVQPFPYADAVGIFPDRPIGSEVNIAEIEQRARETGRKEGEAAARMQLEVQLKHAQQKIRTTLESFVVEKKSYYQRIEEEAVKLSLAIAQKILHRTVQVDPLVLAGIAHVALQKLDASTDVTLHVSAENVAQWREHFKQYEMLQGKLNISEDSSLGSHSCILKTSLGTTEIGIEAQLQEIEKGFADLLAQRPK